MKNGLIYAGVVTALVALGLTAVAVTGTSKRAAADATYVGQETCMSSGCHADPEGSVYAGAEHFQNTMHYKIHHRPNPENVVIERWFENDTTLRFYEINVHQSPGDTLYIDLSKGETETDYLIQLRTTGPNGDSTGFLPVSYNYGGNGWLQRFLVEVDGSFYPAPFQYVFPHYRETDTDTGKVYFLDLARWYSVDGEKDAIVFHERGTEAFFKESWDKRCVACHVNGFDVEKDVINDSTTQWFAKWAGSDKDSASRDINIAIGCESCHGPGSLHSSDPENAEYLADIDPGRWDLIDTSRYWTDRKLEICGQCHNRHSSTEKVHTYQYDDANGLPYLPKQELANYVNDLVRDARYWDDGKTSAAHHQTGQDYWRSAHYSDHVFPGGCFDCHDPHKNTEYPYQLNRNWYSLNRGEGCLAFGCHPQFDEMELDTARDIVVNAHSRHLAENSQCVNCHYTKTATISFTGTFEFSDHSDQVIRPKATLDHRIGGLVGVPNTCAINCHRNGYGERNRPDAFDEHAAVRFSTGGTPTIAPDFGIQDRLIDFWRENSDIDLADTLWLLYQDMYADLLLSVQTGDAVAGSAGITALTPNPASEHVTIRFNLPNRQKIRLEIYDAQGRIVRTIAIGTHEAGQFEDDWRGIDETNRPVPSGTYFVRLSGESFSSTKSVLLYR